MATDFWSEYRRLKKKQLEDTTIDAPVKETAATTVSPSSDDGSAFWSEYRQQKKDQFNSTVIDAPVKETVVAAETQKKEEEEERKAELKPLPKNNNTSGQMVNGRLMQTQTKQVNKDDDVAPVKEGGGGGSFDTASQKKSGSSGKFVSYADEAKKDPEFSKYAKQGAQLANPSFEDASKGISIFGWKPFAEKVGNPVTFVKANSDAIRLDVAMNNGTIKGINYLWANMTDDEVSVYNYYLAKYGEEKATEYLDSLNDELSKREGTSLAENVNGKAVAEVLVGAAAGLDNSRHGLTTGLKNFVTGGDEKVEKTPVQYQDEILAQDNEGVMKVAHDSAAAIGNMLPSIAAGILNPAAGAVVMGAGVAGNKYNEMIEEGYSVGEARADAALTGLAEAGLQSLFGGIGMLGGKAGGKLLSKVAPKAADKIAEMVYQVASKNPRIVNALGNAIKEMGKEAAEEALQTYLEPAIDSWVTKEEYDAPEFEEVMYNALIGAVTSGVLEGAPSVGKATVDTVTKPGVNAEGNTKDEQSVIDKVTEDRVAEKEKGGEKLTFTEKQEIAEKVKEDMEKGYISTDTIEEVLGGDEHKAYTDAVAQEDALRKEYEELGALEKPTLAQKTRFEELHGTKDSFMSDDNRNALREKVSESVRERVKNSRLSESYNERARRGQYFEDDPAAYKNENARKTVENLVGSKLANNTRRTRELADTVVKIAEDKGITFDFTNNEKIKADGKAYISKKNLTADGSSAVFDLGAKNLDADFKPVVTVDGETVSGFSVDYASGKVTFDSVLPANAEIHIEYRRSGVVNGFYDSKSRTVTVNMDSPKAWQFIVGHEVTHSLEGTDAYNELQDAIKKYAETKGDYSGRKDALSSAYNSGTDIDTEITSDLVGEYLFTDEEFVNQLSANNRNLFQKIYDEIKHLYKMVTAGSKEARELERVKHAFEKAYRAQAQKNTAANGGVQHDITVLEDGKMYVSASRNVIKGTTLEEQRRDITNFFNDLLQGNPSLDIQTVDGDVLTITKADTASKARDDHKTVKGERVQMTAEEFGVKLRSEAHIDELAEISFKIDKGRDEKNHTIAKDGFTYRKAFFEDFDGQYYEITLSIGHNGTVATVYNVGKIKEGVQPSATIVAGVGSKPLGRTPSADIIPQNSEKSSGNSKNVAPIGVQHSISVGADSNSDKEYLDAVSRGDTAAQERIIEEAARKAGYSYLGAHRTNADFTVFDKKKIGSGSGTQLGNGFYVSLEIKDEATAKYAEEAYGGKEMRLFVKMDSPLILGDPIDSMIISEMRSDLMWFGDDETVRYGVSPETVEAQLRSDDKFDQVQALRWIADKNFMDISDLVKMYGFDGIISENEYVKQAVVFDENQLKSADLVTYDNSGNIIPPSKRFRSENDDIRYSLGVDGISETNRKLDEIGVQYDAESETVSYSLGSLEDTFDYNKGESAFVAARGEYVDALVKATGKSREEANRYIDSLFLIHDMIAADSDRLDYDPAENRTAWVSNSEYGGSIDFSTLCAKRRLFTGTFDAIQNELPDTVLNENDFLRIRNLLLEHGEESPCSMCYVEGSRAKHGVYVDKWLKDYLKTDPEWKPQLADFTSSTRLERTRINHPEAYAAYQKAMNSLAQRKPKEASVRTDYKGEILRDFKNSSTVAEKNKNGGVRFNSFSDFEIIHTLDCMQVITDMARVGLNGQAYTKVKEFAEAFGNTGLKINLSLVAKDVDANGNLVLDETNGMSYAEAMDIRSRYSENVGTVIVVFNDAQLKAALADSTIDYVLPFHRSQWKKSQYAMMGLPGLTKDYTMVQNDRATNPKTGKPAKLSKLKITTTYTNDVTGETFEIKDNIMPNQYWDFSKSGRENAQRYLDYINANRMTPKFDSVLEKVDGKWTLPEGAVGDGYFKLLIDFKMYDNDGWGAPQNPVIPEFNMPYIQTMLDNYIGGHQSFPVAHDVVEEFVKEKLGKHSIDSGIAPVRGGDWRTPARELRYDGEAEDVAPVVVDDVVSVGAFDRFVSEIDDVEIAGEEVEEDIAPVDELKITTAKERIGAKLSNTQTEIDRNTKLRADAKAGYEEKIAELQKLYDGKKNKNTKTANNILRRIERLRRLSGNVDADYAKRISDLEGRRTSLSDQMNQDHTRADRLELAYARIDRDLAQRKAELAAEFAQRRAAIEERIADRNSFISAEAGALYDELTSLRKGVRASKELGYLLDHGFDWASLKAALVNVKRSPGEVWNVESEVEPLVREAIAETYDARAAELAGLDNEHAQETERLEADAEEARAIARKAEERFTRTALHQNIIDNLRTRFAHNGFDLDAVLKGAKNLSTFATVDNTPQRVMEKSLGYREGGILADMTVNRVAQNESEAIRWLNSFTDRKNGLLAELSREYRIKPGSKESAAAQMYAEGFYVTKDDKIIAYGDKELEADFPDKATQDRIKGLSRDPRIRLVYDQTLDMINESRTRNAYPEIPRRENYFLHFRAMEDTFSRLGLPFNPNDIRAKDLPTDLNGVTADLKPGQPYFASAMRREGKRTNFDLLGGMERYLSSAKNQIFHIDDIQTLRALRNYIADSYGQAKGLESLDAMTEEEVQDRIKEVYGAHLSTFAKFLNEEANIIAGKTSLADRGIEGIFGRRAITFINDVNRQVGANMVGYNVSSSLTNFIPVVQTFAKTNKFDFIKAFAQTVNNKLGGIIGRTDGFVETSPVMIRRRGADRFHRTVWQKMSDPGYVLMGAVDSISTEVIARTKYNELTRKGMDSERAHVEADKWVSRLMGDRSLGQNPQLYESKVLGIVTKFQLEVRNQLDSMFYDTVQEAKASNADIENNAWRNAKTAAKAASVFFELAVAQHLFGKVFESIAGYNPAFDIIEVIAKTLGLDDDDDSEDTTLDNLEQGFLALLEDLPYTSTLTGGRIPISSALPISELVKGKDEYGNEVSRLKTAAEAAPYYFLPGGYGQIKKTVKGLSMFDDDHPVSGSYTDSGNLRFPVEDTWQNRVQAAVFGQWANENARDYIDNERSALKPKQIDEYVASDMTIGEYWDYRDGLKGLSKVEEYAAYINGLDIPVWKKNLLINNLTDRKEPIRMEDYSTYGSIAESDFARDNPERYDLLKQNGVTYEQYTAFDDSEKNAYTWAAKNPEKYEFIKSIGYAIEDYADASDAEKDAWTWAYNNPEKYEVSKAVSDDLFVYRQYTGELSDIKADKDADGKSISGSRKEKVLNYINGLDADYGAKVILFKSEYPADDTYNNDIIDYLNGRDDISYEQMVTILRELGFKVSGNDITW